MPIGLQDVAVAIFSGSLGTVLGTAGGAYGATLALKKELQVEKDDRKDGDNELSIRADRLEQRVGITRDGALTGNGLISIARDNQLAIAELQRQEG